MNQTRNLLATTLEGVSGNVDAIGKTAGFNTAITVPGLVGSIISILLGLLGLVFLVLVVYAGFLYLTAQGEDAQVKKAKSILTKAVIGMAIVISSYAITNVVVDSIAAVTTGTATATE